MISVEQLRRFPAFAGVEPESLRKLAMTADALTFERDETLFRDGDPADTLFLITGGEVDIQYHLNTDQRVTVDTLIAGDLLSWSAVVPPYQCTATAVARAHVDALAFSGPELRELLEADHNLGYGVMKDIARATSQRLSGARVQLATR